tara:strand:+ start:222 stop:458 length:237 start_codon:yes stop_codon:yes gene_type:complete
MTAKNKKKIGYSQFEELLALAHKKADILAQRIQALQSYLTSYVEYRNDNVKFNDWINQRIIEEQEEVRKEKEQVNEKV